MVENTTPAPWTTPKTPPGNESYLPAAPDLSSAKEQEIRSSPSENGRETSGKRHEPAESCEDVPSTPAEVPAKDTEGSSHQDSVENVTISVSPADSLPQEAKPASVEGLEGQKDQLETYSQFAERVTAEKKNGGEFLDFFFFNRMSTKVFHSINSNRFFLVFF